MTDPDVLRAILTPRSIAVIGASPSENTYGERAVRHFEKLAFAGKVYCVNPRYQTIAGFDCFPNVSAIPGHVDTAVVTVARQHVPQVIADLGSKGCRGAVVLSSGFGEANDGQGGQLERDLLDNAKHHGIRLFGPNTNGLVNVVGKVPLGVCSVMDRPSLLTGYTAVVSQSGSLAAALADQLMDSGIGVSYVFGMGNAIDVDIADVMMFLARDPDTRVVLVFLEGLRDPAKFFQAIEAIDAAGKLPVVLKVGRSAQGKLAAATHSGSVAGSWQAFCMLASERGAVIAETPEDASAICGLAARAELGTAVARVRIITMSGALCGLAADEAALVDLPLDPPCEDARTELEDMGYRGPQNPLDFGEMQRGANSPPDFKRACRALLEDPGCDALLVATGLTAQLPEMAKQIVELSSEIDKPIYAYVVGGVVAKPFGDALGAAGIPVFRDLRKAVRSIRFGGKRFPREMSNVTTSVTRPLTKSQSKALAVAAASPTEYNLANFLSEFGLAYPAGRLVQNEEQATVAANAIEMPVVVKVVGPKILHKAASGLVRLSLGNEDSVRTAFAECRRNAIDADLWDGNIVVQKMMPLAGGLELMLAARRDPEVGSILLVGPGGLLVEAIPSAVSISRLPQTEDDVHRLIERSEFLTKLFHGRVKLDLDGFVACVLAFSAAAGAALSKFSTIEVNPLVVMRRGQGCWALDASAVLHDAGLQ